MHRCIRALFPIPFLCLCLADALRIDDLDPAVQYHGPWTFGTNFPDDASRNWEGTLHYANISGATATLNFTGTSIAVFGSFHPPGRYSMQSQYSIDSQKPFVFLPNQEVPAATHQTLFYSSPRLSLGVHTLVVKNLGEQLFLDFFDVQDENEPETTSTAPEATSTTGPNTQTQTVISSSGGGIGTTVTVISTSVQAGASKSPTTSDSRGPSVDQQTTDAAAAETIDASGSLHSATQATPPPGSLAQPTTGTAVPSDSAATSGSTAAAVGAAQSPTGGRSRGLSKGAVAGIALGSLIIAAVLGAALWWYRRSRERTWLVTDLHFEPSKMSVPDPSFRGHRPTLPGLDGRDVIYGAGAGRRASEQRRSAPSSSVHLIGYSSSTPSTYSE